MLKDLIAGRIQFAEGLASWEEALILGAKPLIAEGFCTAQYCDSMVAAVKEFGPYIVLCDGLAMPHSRPENGAIKTGMSFLSLKKGVLFPDTEVPVRLLFTLSAADSDSHIDAMMQLADLAGDEASLNALMGCASPEDLLKIINK